MEEQKAQAQYRYLRGRQIACMIHGHFRSTGACEAALDLSDLFTLSLQGDDIQDFDTRWEFHWLQVKYAKKKRSLYKVRIRESVQHQTV